MLEKTSNYYRWILFKILDNKRIIWNYIKITFFEWTFENKKYFLPKCFKKQINQNEHLSRYLDLGRCVVFQEGNESKRVKNRRP